jgi:hypothetical protein
VSTEDEKPPEPAAPATPAAAAAAPATPAAAAPAPATPAAAGAPEVVDADIEPFPPVAAEESLRDAVGIPRKLQRFSLDEPAAKPAKSGKPADPAKPRRPEIVEEDDDGDPRRRLWAWLIVFLVLGGGISSMVFLGRSNAARYYFSCEPDRIVAERGRSFPPWGKSSLDGAAWKAIKIPPSAECVSTETKSPAELEGAFVDALIDQATARLAAHTTADVDEAERQLNQALLLSRAPETQDRRKRLERLLGDVVYWRAAALVEAGIVGLDSAAKTFDDAWARQPQHVTDASRWAEHVRAIIEELRRGPAAMRTSATGTSPPFGPPPGDDVRAPDKDAAPPGVLLPLEVDAGPPPPPVDAALPTGGVLL